ncbi:MAG: histidine kinase [Flavobacteriales bacterium]|nr:histidine kinase [Flavobacteriales bacterium]
MLQFEQQALNANMNRHFIFNALNSIQYSINRQDRTMANKYLTSFAKLIRKNLDASQNDTTTLAEELSRLELYLVLEHMRFKDKFQYSVSIAPEVDTHAVKIPAMMLQPYVENSIWHGILPMARPGRVEITVDRTAEGRTRSASPMTVSASITAWAARTARSVTTSHAGSRSPRAARTSCGSSTSRTSASKAQSSSVASTAVPVPRW